MNRLAMLYVHREHYFCEIIVLKIMFTVHIQHYHSVHEYSSHEQNGNVVCEPPISSVLATVVYGIGTVFMRRKVYDSTRRTKLHLSD